MANNNGVISPPVSVHDVQTALGNSSPDVGRLCVASNINMWAKYKPVRFAQITPINDTNRVAVNYGITNIPTWTNLNKLVNYWLGIDTSSTNYPECGIQQAYWQYERPVGSMQSPFRLSDFSEYPVSQNEYGYFHRAAAPIGDDSATTYYVSCKGKLRILYAVGALDARTLQLSDLTWPGATSFPIANMHFGVVMHKVSSSTGYAVTQRVGSTELTMADLAQYGAWVDIDVSSEQFAGNYEIAAIASNYAIQFSSSLSPYNNGKFIALLDRRQVAIAIQKAQANIVELAAYKNPPSDTRYIHYGFTLTNDMEISLTVSCELTVMKADGVTAIASTTHTVSMPNGSTRQVASSIDLASISGGFTNASSVRLIVTVSNTDVVFKHTAAASANITIGPSPWT